MLSLFDCKPRKWFANALMRLYLDPKGTVSLVLAPEVVRESGLVGGTSVDVLWDRETQTGMVQRRAQGGWKLRRPKRCGTLFIKFGLLQNIGLALEPGKGKICTVLKVEKEKVTFQVPE